MNKEHKLFDKKFVHFMWDDELEGKKGFIAKSVKDLKNIVNANYCKELICNSHDEEYPFLAADDNKYHFAYYDSNYDAKWAFYKEGKMIQFRYGSADWQDNTSQNPCWDDEDREWRIKPEDKPCDEEQEKRAEPTFQEELRGLLNRFGMDNECDTPDHILRDYLVNCLENYRIITKRNMLWHGWLGLGAELTEEGWKKSVESALKFLMDNRVIKSWHYNGIFHVEGNK